MESSDLQFFFHFSGDQGPKKRARSLSERPILSAMPPGTLGRGAMSITSSPDGCSFSVDAFVFLSESEVKVIADVCAFAMAVPACGGSGLGTDANVG